MKVLNIKEGLHWRYQKYLAPFVDLYGSPFLFLKNKYYNRYFFKRSHIIYIYANRRNIGDYISFLGIQKMMKRQGVELYCASIGKKQLQKILYQAEQSPKKYFIIVGGGGLLQSVFNPFWEYIAQSSIPFALFGIGINHMAGRDMTPPSLLSKIINQSVSTSVRDYMTRDAIEDIAKKKVPVNICPSVNLLYPKYYSDKTEDEQLLLLHVIHPADLKMANGDISKIRNTLSMLAQDLGLTYKEYDNMGCNYTKAVRLYKKAKFVISSRLHGCIISHAMGIPFIALNCDRKIQAFLDTHHGGLAVEVEKFNDKKQVEILMKSLEKISRENLEKQVKSNQVFAKKLQTIIKENINVLEKTTI